MAASRVVIPIQTKRNMRSPLFPNTSRVVSALLAIAVGGLIAGRFSWFAWAEDTCLDAGGAFRDRTCQLESASYIMNPWPPTVAAWLITTMVLLIPAGVVFLLASSILGRLLPTDHEGWPNVG